MSGLIAGGEVGNVFVVTTNNRGMNAEEMADLAINRILNVSDNTPMP
jgi:aspartate oxidase